jgi:hypothetical protein
VVGTLESGSVTSGGRRNPTGGVHRSSTQEKGRAAAGLTGLGRGSFAGPAHHHESGEERAAGSAHRAEE